MRCAAESLESQLDILRRENGNTKGDVILMKRQLSLTTKLTMNDGRQIPQFGFGTSGLVPNRTLGEVKSEDGEIQQEAIQYALSKGIRLLDSAARYHSEGSVGKAIRASGIPRDEIFVITKVWTDRLRAGQTRQSLEASLKELGLDYVDMLMLHWPVGTTIDQLNWKIAEDLRDAGLCKSIGVSNYKIHHLKEILRVAKYLPACNEVECHPFYNCHELIGFCRQYDIKLCACRPLGGMINGELRMDPTLIDIGRRYGKSNIQVILRWHLQRGTVIIPKTTHKEHLDTDLDVFDFELSEEDMRKIDAMDTGFLKQDPDDMPF